MLNMLVIFLIIADRLKEYPLKNNKRTKEQYYTSLTTCYYLFCILELNKILNSESILIYLICVVYIFI